MPSRNEERWKSLCEQATREQDPNRLMELVEEINMLLGDDSPQETGKNVAHPTKTRVA